MSSVNKVILVGNLGADPEIRQAGQSRVAELRIATSRKFKTASGQLQEETEWHTVVVWGRSVEFCEQYLHTGRQGYVEGRLRTRTWEDAQSGAKRSKTEVVALDVQGLGGKEDRPRGGKSQPAPSAAPQAGPRGYYSDDDIPF